MYDEPFIVNLIEPSPALPKSKTISGKELSKFVSEVQTHYTIKEVYSQSGIFVFIKEVNSGMSDVGVRMKLKPLSI